MSPAPDKGSPLTHQAGSESISFQIETLSEACPLLEAAAWTPKSGGGREQIQEKKKTWPIKVNNPGILMDPTASE